MEAVRHGAVQRFRPILMTMLVASLGLVPAATSHDIGSDSQRPFAIVIVGGLMAVLIMMSFVARALRLVCARFRLIAAPYPRPDQRRFREL